jgi:hypothetical protein
MTVDFKGTEVNKGTERKEIEIEVDNKECERQIHHTFLKHAM